MTMTLRSATTRDGRKGAAADGDLVTDSELDSFRQGYAYDQRQPININQPLKAYKGSGGMIQFVPYSAKKNIKKKVPAMLDNDFDNTKAAAQAEIDTAAGAGAVNASWTNLNGTQKATALKGIRKLQKVSLSIGMVTDKQWEQIFEDLKIKSRPLKNQNTTDYKDMRDEVDKRIREYAGKRNKNGFAKTVALDDEDYKKYINKYLKSVRNYYMEENDLKVLARPVFRNEAANDRNIYVNVNAAGPAGVAAIGVGAGAATSDFILGSGINPESTPKTTTAGAGLIAAGANAGFFFSTTQHAVRAGAQVPGTKSDTTLLNILSSAAAPGVVPAAPAPPALGNRFPIISDDLNHAAVGGIRLYTKEERAVHELPALQKHERMREVIKLATLNAGSLSAANMGTSASQISVFSDGVYYDPAYENDKALKALKDLIEKLFKIFIDRTNRFLEENPDANQIWTALDGGKRKKHVSKSARGHKRHSGSKHKKKKSARK